jgi:Zn-finger nucleic acid-binding protein
MHSPIHSDVTLQPKEIEPGLSAYECPKSGGVWIPLQSYLNWKETRPEQAAALPRGYTPVADDSKQRALLCPESGRVLIRYRVGHGLHFHVDRSSETGGMWLDPGEWEALKSKGLHTELNLIFTAPYQRHIRAAEYEEALERAFRERIGHDDFQKVVEIKQWIAGHPKRRDLWCYLKNEFELREEENESAV